MAAAARWTPPLGLSVLEIAHKNSLDLEGACEGSLACSTCHVVIEPEWFDVLPDAQEDEEDMLDLAFGLTKTLASRLPDHHDRRARRRSGRPPAGRQQQRHEGLTSGAKGEAIPAAGAASTSVACAPAALFPFPARLPAPYRAP